MGKAEEQIDWWGVIELYSRAYKKGAWLEVLSLGYTLLETQLIFLLTQTKVGHDGIPLEENKVKKCYYLLDLAALAKEEKFISEELFLDIKNFNDVRKNAIHNLTSGKVTYKDISDAAKNVGNITAKIQSLYLQIKVVADESIDDMAK